MDTAGLTFAGGNGIVRGERRRADVAGERIRCVQQRHLRGIDTHRDRAAGAAALQAGSPIVFTSGGTITGVTVAKSPTFRSRPHAPAKAVDGMPQGLKGP